MGKKKKSKRKVSKNQQTLESPKVVAFMDLPEDIIHHIFSYLGGNGIPRMTCVSRSFRELCMRSPRLDFKQYLGRRRCFCEEFYSVVTKMLTQRDGLPIQRLRLRSSCCRIDNYHFGSWIEHASDLKVQELDLSFCPRIVLPLLLDKLRSLVSLKLKCVDVAILGNDLDGNSAEDWVSSRYKSLKRLHLSLVAFKHQRYDTKLTLSISSPFLEQLVIDRCLFEDAPKLKLRISSTLQKLEISDCKFDDRVELDIGLGQRLVKFSECTFCEDIKFSFGSYLQELRMSRCNFINQFELAIGSCNGCVEILSCDFCEEVKLRIGSYLQDLTISECHFQDQVEITIGAYQQLEDITGRFDECSISSTDSNLQNLIASRSDFSPFQPHSDIRDFTISTSFFNRPVKLSIKSGQLDEQKKLRATSYQQNLTLFGCNFGSDVDFTINSRHDLEISKSHFNGIAKLHIGSLLQNLAIVDSSFGQRFHLTVCSRQFDANFDLTRSTDIKAMFLRQEVTACVRDRDPNEIHPKNSLDELRYINTFETSIVVLNHLQRPANFGHLQHIVLTAKYIRWVSYDSLSSFLSSGFQALETLTLKLDKVDVADLDSNVLYKFCSSVGNLVTERRKPVKAVFFPQDDVIEIKPNVGIGRALKKRLRNCQNNLEKITFFLE